MERKVAMAACEHTERRNVLYVRDSSHVVVQVTIGGVALATAWFVPWLIRDIDLSRPLLTLPFLAAFIYLIFQTFVSMINSWQWKAAPVQAVRQGDEPPVAVIVPTCGEPPEMVYRTAVSVLSQYWPTDSLVLVISDDAASDHMAAMSQSLGHCHPTATIYYHRPPTRGSARRRGDAKAGNLNSALDLLAVEHANIEYIETRDADDEVGHPSFLRWTVRVLMDDQRVAFTQTIKECRVDEGDPFNNLEQLFYRGVMLGRHAANAVFPCGSGVVWRRRALQDIGGFPSWNLVEDLQSGVEALRRGWRGAYLPIVGAKAQHSPQDLANVYKQRGTWALDTMRLLIWRSMEGMVLRQKLQFFEMALFYCQGFPMMILTVTSAVYAIQGFQPVLATPGIYMLHFIPYVISVELFVWALSTEARVKNHLAWRRMWYGMMLVNMWAVAMAIAYGPHRKPTYRVTRKVDLGLPQWYWQKTLPHFLIVAGIFVAVSYGAVAHGIHSILRPDTIYWLLFNTAALGSFVPLGWYGSSPRQYILSRVRSRSSGTLPTGSESRLSDKA